MEHEPPPPASPEPSPRPPLAGLRERVAAAREERERQRQDPAVREREAAECEAASQAFRASMAKLTGESFTRALHGRDMVGMEAWKHAGDGIRQTLKMGSLLGVRQQAISDGLLRGASGLRHGEALFTLTRNPLDDLFRGSFTREMTFRPKAVADVITASLPAWEAQLDQFWADELTPQSEEAVESTPGAPDATPPAEARENEQPLASAEESGCSAATTTAAPDAFLVQHRVPAITVLTVVLVAAMAATLYLQHHRPDLWARAAANTELFSQWIQSYIGLVVAVLLVVKRPGS